MTIIVIGAGAVGSLLGWALATSGEHVVLVRRGQAGGPEVGALDVVAPDGSRSARAVTLVRAAAELTEPPDLVLVAVKQYDVAAAAAELVRWPAVPVLTVENGVGAEEVVRGVRPAAPLMAGSLTAAVAREDDGAVRWLRPGGIGIAPVQGDVGLFVARLVRAFASAGLPARAYAHAAAMKWSKLVANLVGNATSALLDLDPGAVYRHPGLYLVERAQLREALAVMRRRHLPVLALPGADVRLLALATTLPPTIARPIVARVIAASRGGKSPSLRLHLATGSGPTEVAWLNGAVARVAAATGVPAPVNARLAALVDEAAADPARRTWFRGRPDRLIEALSDPAAG